MNAQKGDYPMAHGHYTAQFKTDIVLEVIQGENGLEEIALHYGLNPNMIRNWKREKPTPSRRRRPGCLKPSGS